ncbi:MAG: hypothetical protein LBE27_01950, partial [Deltaproteobacteria bacterium]|nr:hypothetical protein [Deltaproteobacteria bacterium]
MEDSRDKEEKGPETQLQSEGGLESPLSPKEEVTKPQGDVPAALELNEAQSSLKPPEEPHSSDDSTALNEPLEANESNESKPSKLAKFPLKLLNKVKGREGLGLKELKAYLPALGALLIPLSFLLYYQLVMEPRARGEKEWNNLLDAALPFVRAEDNSYPDPPDSILKSDYRAHDATLLRDSLQSFFKENYELARKGLTELEGKYPNEKRLYPMLGATHMRDGNFSLARDYFLKSQASPFEDKELNTLTDMGLALSYFYLMELKPALAPARKAYQTRLLGKGLGSTETQSSANVLAAILIGLGETAEAEGILEDHIRGGIKEGESLDSVLMIDALNLLSFSYSLSDSGKDIMALMNQEEPQKGALEPAPSLLTPPKEEETLEASANSDPKATETPPPARGEGSNLEPSGKAAKDAAYNFPAALSIYNDLTKLKPQSPLRSELLLNMIDALAPAGKLCEDPGDVPLRGSLWQLCVDLADSLMDANYSPETLTFAENLLSWKEMGYERRAYLIYEIASLEKAEAKDYQGAVDMLRKAMELLSKQETPSESERTFLALRGITLADLMAQIPLTPLEREIELTAAVSAIERTLPKKDREGSLELPFLYWYLARHLRDQGRTRDARNYFQKAERSVDQLLKLHKDKNQELTRLLSMIKDDRNHRKGQNPPPRFPNSPRIFYPAYLEASKTPKDRISSPATMRVELEALKFLGKTQDFAPMIQKAMEMTPPESPERLRYESLNLKYLEEVGDSQRLFAELNNLYNNPQGTDADAKAVFQSSVMAYEGRVRSRSGDLEGARAAYEKALALLEPVSGNELR